MNKKYFSVKELKTTLPIALKLVYLSNPVLYTGISVIVFSSFWIIFNVFDQLLFFSPILYFYIPDDAQIGFVITNISAALLGIVISMNICNKNIKVKNKQIIIAFRLLIGNSV